MFVSGVSVGTCKSGFLIRLLNVAMPIMCINIVQS